MTAAVSGGTDLDAVLPLVHFRLQAPLLLCLLAEPPLQLPVLLSHEPHAPLKLLQPRLALGRQRHQSLCRLLLLLQHLGPTQPLLGGAQGTSRPAQCWALKGRRDQGTVNGWRHRQKGKQAGR